MYQLFGPEFFIIIVLNAPDIRLDDLAFLFFYIQLLYPAR